MSEAGITVTLSKHLTPTQKSVLTGYIQTYGWAKCLDHIRLNNEDDRDIDIERTGDKEVTLTIDSDTGMDRGRRFTNLKLRKLGSTLKSIAMDFKKSNIYGFKIKLKITWD